MKGIIGIHLGVDETRVARIGENGEPMHVLNHDFQASTTTAVHFANNNVIIGSLAKDAAGIEEHAFSDFLRDLGRGITHKTPHGTFSPSDLCALMFRPLIGHFSEYYGEVSGVSIAIPYNLGNEARLEILRAATLVGVHKPYLLNDNTAEVLYLRQAHKLKKGKYLLVNLKACSADTTIFEVAGNSVSIAHVSGLYQIGLKDLKHAMSGIISEKIAQKIGAKVTRDDLLMEYGIGDYSLNNIIQGLGTQNTLKHIARGLESGLIEIEISRDEFRNRIASLTQQLEHLIETAQEKAGISPRDLNGCFLSTSEIDRPFWAPSISSALGMQPLSTPEGSIAKGAALYAATKSREEDLPPMGQDELKSINVQDLAPYYVGILEIDWLTQTKRNRIVIPKGELLPCKRTFELVADDSGRIPEIVVTTSYVAEDDADKVSVLTSINPKQSTARSKHTLTIIINDNGQTSATLQNEDGKSTCFMETNT